MLFIERMQEKLGKIELSPEKLKKVLKEKRERELLSLIHRTQENEFLLLLKKINDSAEKTAKYLYDNMDSWYDLALFKENYLDEETLNKETLKNFCKLFDEIVIDPKTFEYNIEKLDEIIGKIKIKRSKFYIHEVIEKNDDEKYGVIKRKEYKNSLLERMVIELGSSFLICNLYILILKEYKEIIDNKDIYDLFLQKIIIRIENALSSNSFWNNIFYDYNTCLYYNSNIYSFEDIFKYKVEDEELTNYKNNQECLFFKVLGYNNQYIKMIKNKNFIELIKELKTVKIENNFDEKKVKLESIIDLENNEEYYSLKNILDNFISEYKHFTPRYSEIITPEKKEKMEKLFERFNEIFYRDDLWIEKIIDEYYVKIECNMEYSKNKNIYIAKIREFENDNQFDKNMNKIDLVIKVIETLVFPEIDKNLIQITKKTNIICDARKIYDSISIFSLEVMDFLGILEELENKQIDEIVRIVGEMKYFEKIIKNYYIRIEYIKNDVSSIKIIKIKN